MAVEATYPGHDGRVAQVLVDHDVELALKLLLLLGIGERHTGRDSRHVLDDHEPQGVSSIVEQVWLDFDLLGGQVCQHLAPVFNHKAHNARRIISSLTCFRTALKPSFFSSCRSKIRAS